VTNKKGLSIPHEPTSVGRAWPLALLVAVALFCRLYRLPTRDITGDEAFTSLLCSAPAQTILSGEKERFPPIGFLIYHFWGILFGHELAIQRTLSALLGCATVVLTLQVGRRFVPPVCAWISAFALALSSLHIELSNEVRHYAILGCLTLLQISFLEQLDGRKTRFFLCVLITAALLYTHYNALFLVATEMLLALTQSGKTRSRKTTALVLACLLWLPWIPVLRSHVQVESSSWTFNFARSKQWLIEAPGDFFFILREFTARRAPAQVQRIGALAAATTIAGLLLIRRTPAVRLLALWALPISMSIGCNILFSYEFTSARRCSFLLPFFLWTLSLVVTLPGVFQRWFPASILLIPFCLASGHVMTHDERPEEPWKELSAHLKRAIPPGAEVSVWDELSRWILTEHHGVTSCKIVSPMTPFLPPDISPLDAITYRPRPASGEGIAIENAFGRWTPTAPPPSPTSSWCVNPTMFRLRYIGWMRTATFGQFSVFRRAQSGVP
jgi:hypothetical protein